MNKKLFCFILISFILILALASCSDNRSECEINGHTFAGADCTTAPTCTACGATDGEPLGHDYTETVTDSSHLRTTANDCTEYNTYWYGCSRCDAVAGDSLSLDKWYTTTEIGAHNLSADWYSENGQHFHKCVNSGCNFTDGHIDCSGGKATCLSPAECSVCGNTYGTLGGHDFDLGNWGYVGADGHAHTCTLCGERDEILSHNPNIDAATEDVEKLCTDCGFVIESLLPHTHRPATSFEYDGEYHWHDCVKNDGEVYDKAAHTFDNECDVDCNDGCGYVRSITHDYSVLKHNDTEHWYECLVCGVEKNGSRVDHTYTSETVTAPKTFTTGLALYTCHCGENYTETIAPTKRSDSLPLETALPSTPLPTFVR